jgi:hypothetical protein
VNITLLIVTIASAVIAGLSVAYGRRSARASETSATAAGQSATSSDRSASAAEQSVGEARRSADAAERSAEAAAVTAQLDTGRRHSELTPRMRIECGQGVQMTVTFKGPAELQRLDELAVTVRNDHAWRGRGPEIAAGPSPEQIAAHVWGPLRFAPGSAPPGGTGPDEHGRTSIARGVPVGESVMFVMEPTRPPKWSASSLTDWQREMGALLRLELTCQAPGWEPWTATCEGQIISGRGVIEVPQQG